ncbi:DUF2946 family protein [Bradyrhizobium sp. 2TAF24]|uniref:DUF2946 family protein n=1 Tax=Bradyrhizobium sp. 2TAF24 TaxID=3233011 RepID=UPI003F8E7AB5
MGRRRSWLRKVVALAAGHALALQLLLAGIVATQMAVAPAAAVAAALCADLGHGSAPDGQPATGLHHVPCAVCAFAAAAAPLPQAGALDAPRSLAHAIERHDDTAAFAAARRHDPRSSQGPPLNA